MRGRLIFLDFDGVLNDPYWLTKVWSLSHKPNFFELDPLRVELLWQACCATNAALVLSSSWNARDGVKEYFEKLNFKVVGQLGYFSHRGEAIDKWIKDHCAEKSDYLILDDERSEYSEEQLKHLVQTSQGYQSWTKDNLDQAPKLVGLNEEHLKKIKEIWHD